MTRKLIEKVNLIIRKGSKLELVSYTSHNRPFLEICEDIKVVIRRLKTRYPIFVVKAGDYDFVLDQPFLNFMEFSQKYKPDKIFGTIIHPYTYQIVVFYILAP